MFKYIANIIEDQLDTMNGALLSSGLRVQLIRLIPQHIVNQILCCSKSSHQNGDNAKNKTHSRIETRMKLIVSSKVAFDGIKDT